jgi:hypothetical protein
MEACVHFQELIKKWILFFLVKQATPTMGTSTAAGAEEGASKSKAKTVTKAKITKAKTVRTKKPTATTATKGTTKASVSSNQATYSAARTAQMDLAGQRTAAAARLSDPLWYRIEDILPLTLDETAMAMPATKVLPEQVQIVESALLNNNMSRSDVTPQAFCMLLEQARRHARLCYRSGSIWTSSGRFWFGSANETWQPNCCHDAAPKAKPIISTNQSGAVATYPCAVLFGNLAPTQTSSVNH